MKAICTKIREIPDSVFSIAVVIMIFINCILMANTDFLENPNMLLKTVATITAIILIALTFINGERLVLRVLFGFVAAFYITFCLYYIFPDLPSSSVRVLVGYIYITSMFAASPFVYANTLFIQVAGLEDTRINWIICLGFILIVLFVGIIKGVIRVKDQ